MSKSQSKIPSPARSQGFITPRRRIRRTLSSASPAQSEGRLSTVVEKFVKSDKFVLSPMKRRSVLPDSTDIEAPRRASWWKRLEGSSRDVLEALDTNKMPDDLLLEEYEFEVEKDDKQSQSAQQSHSSENESVASIVVPQRRLFNQKKQSEANFGDIMGSRKSLGKTNIEDHSIEDAPKTLFNKGPRNRPIFPAALLNSTNKTINKTVEPETNKQTRPNLFGQAGTKRKNMFADFVLSDSEEDSEVQHKVFGFKKNSNKRLSLGTRNRRMPSLTPSVTTEIDIDDWNLLPSSTMIGTQEGSRISDKDMELQDENQDNTLTEDVYLNRTNKQAHKSVIQVDENDKTLTNENIEDANKSQDVEVNDVSKQVNKTQEKSKTKLNTSVKDKSLRNKSTKQATSISNAENVQIEEVVAKQQENNTTDKNTRLAENEQSLEDRMAELHRETVVSEKSRPNKTEENPDIYEAAKSTNQHIDSSKQDLAGNICEANEDIDKSEEEIEPSVEEEENRSEQACKTSENVNKSQEQDQSELEQRESEEERGQSEVEQEQRESEEERGQSEVEKEQSELEQGESEAERGQSEVGLEQSEEEQSEEVQEQSEEEQEESEEEQEVSEEEQEQSEEEQEPSLEEQENQNQTDEVIEDQDEDMIQKDKSDEEMPQENQDEEMEEMVWNDNDDEMLSVAAEKKVATEAEPNNEVVQNQNNTSISKHLSKLKQNADKSKNISNKSHKIVDASVYNNLNEEDVVEETPNNSTHDTTGQNMKEVSKVHTPEAVLQNMTNDNESFRPIGRSTTFRKSKSVYETMNMRLSLAPVQESTLGSDGSRNSSTEGSEWDSHRTTRKTIRQTLGKEYTTRKSLRAFVMEQAAKRQTELYNTSKFDKTKNKTVTLDGNVKNTSKMNKTRNKTVVEDRNDKNASTINKTRNKTVIEDANSDKASKDKTRNKTVLDDINEQHIRIHRSSNRNISSNQSSNLKSPVHRTSTRHVPDSLISEHEKSYHKSLHDIEEPKISENLSNPEESVNIPLADNNDSGPEISMNASYGQGMSASGYEIEETSNKINNKDISRRGTSLRPKSIHHSEEVLDYEASEQVISGLEDQENSEHESMPDEKESEPEEEMEQSEQEIESEQEDSQQDIESDCEHETQEIDKPQETEDDQEQSQQEIESDQEMDEEEIESQQEIEDEQEQSRQEIESDQEESQQELEDAEQSQQEIESEQESPQEIESEEEQQSENDHDMSQEQESDHDIRESENDDQDNDDFILAFNSENKRPEKRGVSRIVFESSMMSVEEIDFEGVSRQTDNDITENNESEQEPELSKASLQRVSEPSVHDVSVGTKRSMVMMQMQKIAQKNMEQVEKIREQVFKSVKPPRNYNPMSPIQVKCSIRRVAQPEPRKPKRKPKPTGIPREALPKAFVEDLMYKPPKRFQPANAPWITKRLYKFLESKLEPKYDYRARVRAEQLVQSLFSFCRLARRRALAPPRAVERLKRELARLRVVTTHHDFYHFFHEFMPREIRIKVNPDVVNKIPVPRNVFSDILPPHTVDE